MTLTKAHKLVKLAIKQKEATKEGLLDSKMSWNQGNEMSKDLASGLAEFLEKDIEWLKTVMKLLPPLPKCKHPQELHDKCEGSLTVWVVIKICNILLIDIRIYIIQIMNHSSIAL
ncbi:MAG: hypothetical protein WD154_05420 [Nitrosopumilaceae archaeon]